MSDTKPPWEPETPSTLAEAIYNGLVCSERGKNEDEIIEIHVTDYLRQAFCWALLICEGPEQQELVNALGNKLGIMPKKENV